MVDPAGLETLPAEGGAYVLLVRLDRTVALDIKTFAGATLPAGRYAYCGNAYGPGGIRARVARHLKRDKALRWHVDHLTTAGRIEQVAVCPGGRECDLVQEILTGGGCAVVPGFGSSDCRRCSAHLLLIPGSIAAPALQAAIWHGAG